MPAMRSAAVPVRLVALGTLLLTGCAEPTRAVDAADGLAAGPRVAWPVRTRLTLDGHRFRLNGRLTYPGARAEGLLLNVRMVNAVFEDQGRREFDPERNTAELIDRMTEYIAQGVRAFTVSLQGGYPGYEGARNSAFRSNGSLDPVYLARVERVIERADALGAVVIVSLFYQRQDQLLRDGQAVRAGVAEAVEWLRRRGYGNVILEVANEYGHPGFDHAVLRTDAGVAGLIGLAQRLHPSLPVSASTLGNARTTPRVTQEADLILVHFNQLAVTDIRTRVGALRALHPGKPIVCNEDARTGAAAAAALEASVAAGASYGLMVERINQHYPFQFVGRADDPVTYDRYRSLSLTRLVTLPRRDRHQ